MGNSTKKDQLVIEGLDMCNNYLQAIINSLEDELMVIDRSYRILEVNEAVLRHHGKSREEIIGRYCYDVSHGLKEPCHSSEHQCAIREAWESGHPARVTHVHIYPNEGVPPQRYLDIIASPIRDGQGNIFAVAELMRDVTEAKELELKITELHQEVQRQDAVRGELLREIFSIQEEERRRIARELHDETSQSLASLAASLEAASSMLPAGTEKVKSRLKDAQSLSLSLLEEIHKLIYELRPSLLDDLGLVSAARWLAVNNLNAAGIRASFKVVGTEKRLAPQLEATIFRVIQEVLGNVVKHSQAKNAWITLHFKRRVIEVRIKDDGVGFDVEEAIASRDRPRGLGLIGMRERVELTNGTISLCSAPGEGTEIRIRIPLEQEVKHE
ncbi:MAG: ATP-binding protein [Chloroflexota bacterium]